MKREDLAGRLLAAYSVRLDTDDGPQGCPFTGSERDTPTFAGG